MTYYDYNGQSAYNPWFGIYPPSQIQPQYQYPMQQQQCQCENRFMWIQGKEAAKSYPMAPDKTIFFLDDKESYAYLKKTDKDGKTIQFKTFQLVEEQEPEPVQYQQPSNVVTKDEFDRFTNDINGSIQNLMDAMLNLQNNMNRSYNKQNPQKGQVNKNG
jgi:hypothetical protein